MSVQVTATDARSVTMAISGNVTLSGSGRNRRCSSVSMSSVEELLSPRLRYSSPANTMLAAWALAGGRPALHRATPSSTIETSSPCSRHAYRQPRGLEPEPRFPLGEFQRGNLAVDVDQWPQQGDRFAVQFKRAAEPLWATRTRSGDAPRRPSGSSGNKTHSAFASGSKTNTVRRTGGNPAHSAVSATGSRRCNPGIGELTLASAGVQRVCFPLRGESARRGVFVRDGKSDRPVDLAGPNHQRMEVLVVDADPLDVEFSHVVARVERDETSNGARARPPSRSPQMQLQRRATADVLLFRPESNRPRASTVATIPPRSWSSPLRPRARRTQSPSRAVPSVDLPQPETSPPRRTASATRPS